MANKRFILLGILLIEAIAINRLFAYNNASVDEAYLRTADQKNTTLQYNLGLKYENGDGVPQDYKEAEKLYRASAEGGNAYAQYALGRLYNKGRGVKPDFAEALKWFHKAADQGEPWGQYAVGIMYLKGEEVSQDYEQAYYWFNLALYSGLERARLPRDDAGHFLTPENIYNVWLRGKGFDKNNPASLKPADAPQIQKAIKSPTPDMITVNAVKDTKQETAKKYDQVYLGMVHNIQNNPDLADWGALRKLFSTTSFYSTMDGLETSARDFEKALAKAKAEPAPESIASVKEFLEKQYGNVFVQTKLKTACKDKKIDFVDCENSVKASRGMFLSILNSGDGVRLQTAFEIIDNSEATILFSYYNLIPIEQELLNRNGHTYASWKAKNIKTGKDSQVIFNIDIPMQRRTHEFQDIIPAITP